jgi:hypothetical protein
MIENPESIISSKLLDSARHLIFEVTLGAIQRLFTASRIPFLVLKGPHVAFTLYEKPTDRTYSDLDVLVDPKHYYPAARALLANGFKLFAVNRRRLASERADYQLMMRSPRGVAVELHRALADTSQFRSDVQGLFARAEEFTCGALRLLGLGTEDLLLHLCLHFGKRHFMTSEKKHLLDIALFLKKKKIAWPVFLERVKKAGGRVVSFYCLEAAQRQHGAQVAPDVLCALRPGPLRRRLLERYLAPGVFPIYRFAGQAHGARERFVNLVLLDRSSTMVSSSLRFIGRSVMDGMLRIKPLPRAWLSGHPLKEWIKEG